GADGHDVRGPHKIAGAVFREMCGPQSDLSDWGNFKCAEVADFCIAPGDDDREPSLTVHNLIEATCSSHCSSNHGALGLRTDVSGVFGMSFHGSVREIFPRNGCGNSVRLARAIGSLIS